MIGKCVWKGFGKDALWGLGEDVDVNIGIAFLQCGHYGGGTGGVSKTVWGDKVGNFWHEIFREYWVGHMKRLSARGII